MIDLERIEGIYLYQGITDMRRGIDSLAALASTVMEKKDMRDRKVLLAEAGGRRGDDRQKAAPVAARGPLASPAEGPSGTAMFHREMKVA